MRAKRGEGTQEQKFRLTANCVCFFRNCASFQFHLSWFMSMLFYNILIEFHVWNKDNYSKESYLMRDKVSLKAFKVCCRYPNFAHIPHLCCQTISSRNKRTEGFLFLHKGLVARSKKNSTHVLSFVPCFFVRWIVGVGGGCLPEDSQIINSSYKWLAHWCFVCSLLSPAPHDRNLY